MVGKAIRYEKEKVRGIARPMRMNEERLELWRGTTGENPRFVFLFRDQEAYGDSLYYYDTERQEFVSDYWSIGD